MGFNYGKDQKTGKKEQSDPSDTADYFLSDIGTWLFLLFLLLDTRDGEE